MSFPGPRPWPACSTLAQLPVACSMVTASDGKLSEGLGKRLVARAVNAYQSSKQVVVCCLQASCFTSVVFYKSTALLCGRQQNGQQVADIKSEEMRRCQRVVAILYTLNKLDALRCLI